MAIVNDLAPSRDAAREKLRFPATSLAESLATARGLAADGATPIRVEACLTSTASNPPPNDVFVVDDGPSYPEHFRNPPFWGLLEPSLAVEK